MTLIASKHKTLRTGAVHLRVLQSEFSLRKKALLQRVGTPARWIMDKFQWDWPLTPAAVIALDKVAKELGEPIEWTDGLDEYAKQHIDRVQKEYQVRLWIQEVINKHQELPAYVCRTDIPTFFHQRVSYHWSQYVRGLLLAHDMGTGKTRSACDAAGGWYRNALIQPMRHEIKDGKYIIKGGVLIIAPKTVMRQWSEQIALWQNASTIIISGQAERKKRLALTPAHFHVVNYESLKHVLDNEYDAIIADEAHKLANHTNQTMNTLHLAQNVKKILGLTGTPITNDLTSIFYPMLIIDGGASLGSSRQGFLEKYFYSITTNGGFVKHDAKDNAAGQISAAIAQSTYFISMEEALPDMPGRTDTPIYLEMTNEQLKYYNTLKKEAILYIQDQTVTLEQAQARMMKLLQVCQGFVLTDEGNGAGRHFSDAKSEELIDLLGNGLSNKKVLIWAYFTYEIDRLCDMFKSRGIGHLRVDGQVKSQKDRDQADLLFNTDPRFPYYVRQLSMSEGANLQFQCNNCVYMGLSYKYVDWKQSGGRIRRPGQKHHCTYTYFITENGVDKNVYNSVVSKGELAAAVHDEGKNYFLRLLTEKD